ncbi:hypothetical protein ABZ635_04200 [Nocardiopsis sp. NPDC007018]|uniref:hypothetical protein n=1 Tax=Nocardiopsis sp. NPDC007018 TaxID=3155721 RepID=UPI0033C866ED
MEEPKEQKESLVDALNLKELLGFVPGEDDERWADLQKQVQERISREGGIADPNQPIDMEGFPDE